MAVLLHSSLHIISHGNPGTLYLGNSTLELNNIEQYRPQLQKWDIAHLYLYGCQVAAGDAGAEFLQKLHHITQANIAASTTTTKIVSCRLIIDKLVAAAKITVICDGQQRNLVSSSWKRSLYSNKIVNSSAIQSAATISMQLNYISNLNHFRHREAQKPEGNYSQLISDLKAIINIGAFQPLLYNL